MQESGSGINNPQYTNDAPVTIATPTQDPATGSSNVIDVLIARGQINDCDESDSGDNNAQCTNDDQWFLGLLGGLSQVNDPNTDPVGSNIIDIIGDDDELNNCDESGSGNNDANCQNIAETAISSIAQ